MPAYKTRTSRTAVGSTEIYNRGMGCWELHASLEQLRDTMATNRQLRAELKSITHCILEDKNRRVFKANSVHAQATLFQWFWGVTPGSLHDGRRVHRETYSPVVLARKLDAPPPDLLQNRSGQAQTVCVSWRSGILTVSLRSKPPGTPKNYAGFGTTRPRFAKTKCAAPAAKSVIEIHCDVSSGPPKRLPCS